MGRRARGHSEGGVPSFRDPVAARDADLGGGRHIIVRHRDGRRPGRRGHDVASTPAQGDRHRAVGLIHHVIAGGDGQHGAAGGRDRHRPCTDRDVEVAGLRHAHRDVQVGRGRRIGSDGEGGIASFGDIAPRRDTDRGTGRGELLLPRQPQHHRLHVRPQIREGGL